MSLQSRDTTMKKRKVLIVDDHQLFRKGLKLLLKEIATISVIGEACNGVEFLQMIEEEMPDLVLMDIDMPEMNGIEASKIAIKKHPDLKIITLSMYGDEAYYQKMINAGVKGFLLKDSDSDELEKAIDSVLDGNNYFSQELLYNIIVNTQSGKNKVVITEAPKLSPRELEVLKFICEGLANNEIAEKLYISPRTVERHRANLLSKTQSNNSVSLAMFAIKHNLVNV